MGSGNRGSTLAVYRGDAWTVALDPVVGHEQGGHRPALIVSSDFLHAVSSRLAVVVPLTTRDRQVRSHIAIHPPAGGLAYPSFAMVEQIRAVSRQRFGRRLGRVEPATLDVVVRLIRLFLDL